MAVGKGRGLGAAVLDLVRPPTLSTSRQLTYVTGKTTGVTIPSAARQLGVSTRTLRGWINGKTKPNARSRIELKRVYERFWKIDHRARPAPDISRATLKISATPLGAIVVQRRDRAHILVENTRRDWSGVMAATTAHQAYEAFIDGIIDPSPLPPVPEYLSFHDGDFTIVTV
jgi:hypothetical protein